MNKKVPVKEKYKDGELNKLRNRVKRLELENKELIKKNNKLLSEVSTLETAFEESKKLIKQLDGETTLEEAIKRATKLNKYKKEQKKKKAAKELCPECGDHNIRLIPSRAGTIIVCAKCQYRGVKKK